MRTSAPGQSALLMTDVAGLRSKQGVRHAVIDLDRGSLDLKLSRRMAQRISGDAARIVEDLIGVSDCGDIVVRESRDLAALANVAAASSLAPGRA